MIKMAYSSRKSLSFVGFENGCAELVLKKSPPFEPSCLIDSMLAFGPPGICWVWPATVCTAVNPWVFWITPWVSSTIANTKESGSSTRIVVRTRSTQKFPTVRRPARVSPRSSAAMTAMPVAADTNCWTVSPTIWVRWLMVDSPA